jgi:hypothetical protein
LNNRNFFQASGRKAFLQGKIVLTAQPINHGPFDALTVGTVADPTMRVAVGRATVPASQIE